MWAWHYYSSEEKKGVFSKHLCDYADSIKAVEGDYVDADFNRGFY